MLELEGLGAFGLTTYIEDGDVMCCFLVEPHYKRGNKAGWETICFKLLFDSIRISPRSCTLTGGSDGITEYYWWCRWWWGGGGRHEICRSYGNRKHYRLLLVVRSSSTAPFSSSSRSLLPSSSLRFVPIRSLVSSFRGPRNGRKVVHNGVKTNHGVCASLFHSGFIRVLLILSFGACNVPMIFADEMDQWWENKWDRELSSQGKRKWNLSILEGFEEVPNLALVSWLLVGLVETARNNCFTAAKAFADRPSDLIRVVGWEWVLGRSRGCIHDHGASIPFTFVTFSLHMSRLLALRIAFLLYFDNWVGCPFSS